MEQQQGRNALSNILQNNFNAIIGAQAQNHPVLYSNMIPATQAHFQKNNCQNIPYGSLILFTIAGGIVLHSMLKIPHNKWIGANNGGTLGNWDSGMSHVTDLGHGLFSFGNMELRTYIPFAPGAVGYAGGWPAGNAAVIRGFNMGGGQVVDFTMYSIPLLS